MAWEVRRYVGENSRESFLCATNVMLVSHCAMAAREPLTHALRVTSGCLKNVMSTYIGMVAINDYVFTMANFAGVNISILGSLVYSYVKYNEQQANKRGKSSAALPIIKSNPEMVPATVLASEWLSSETLKSTHLAKEQPNRAVSLARCAPVYLDIVGKDTLIRNV